MTDKNEIKRLLAKYNKPAENTRPKATPEQLERAVEMVKTGLKHTTVCAELRIDVDDYLALPIGESKGFRPSAKQHLTESEIKRRIRKVDELIDGGLTRDNALMRMKIHNLHYYGPLSKGVRKERRSGLQRD